MKLKLEPQVGRTRWVANVCAWIFDRGGVCNGHLKEIKTGLECGGTDHEARAEYTVDERT